MAMHEAAFDAEKEIQDWVFEHIGEFLPGCILTEGFKIITVSGKGGIPDGFAFNLEEKSWYVIECELLEHGVWPHIAEQMTRFVVALKNPESLRKVRDRLFEALENRGLTEEACRLLKAEPLHLHRQIETYIESIAPELVIFIDSIDRDLVDMVNALDISTRSFRIKKLVGEGHVQYYSPDYQGAAVDTTPIDTRKINVYDTLVMIGDVEEAINDHGFRCYRLSGGMVVHPKYSKYHEADRYYWYGMSPSVLQRCEEHSVSEVVFILGEQGYVRIPYSMLKEYLESAGVSRQTNGSIRHYHIYISPPPEPRLYTDNENRGYALQEYFQVFDE